VLRSSFDWRLPILAYGLSVCAACTPVSQQYEIHTPDMTCDEANRHVLDSLVSMGLEVTAFEPARPGAPGYAKAVGRRGDVATGGQVRIVCDSDGVHIDADQEGMGTEHEFERGVYLSVTGRADLVPEREGRDLVGLRKRETVVEDTAERPSEAPAAEPASGVVVTLEPIVGFETVLDFEANLSDAGLLPVRLTIVNATDRAFDFDARDIVLSATESRQRAFPLGPVEAAARLEARNRELIGSGGAQETAGEGPIEPLAATELGDVRAAIELISERAVRAGRLKPNARITGFVYFAAGEYDRARITMVDVATGETEGFLVEF
jgi:hypothetical protein